MANEKWLIDANEFVKHFWQRVHDGEIVTLMDAEHAIINAPTVDAVEVVRCRDCKYWLDMSKPLYCSHYMGDCILDDEPVHRWERDFCSYGEKREV